jgi:plastocyanin
VLVIPTVGAVLALALAGCGGGGGGSGASPTTSSGCRSASQGRVTITAKNVAWDTPCLQAPVGSEVIIEVDNRDDGVNHDFHLKGAPGDPTTPLAAGPATQHLEVALPVGTYRYVCDVHPAMVGELRIG